VTIPETRAAYEVRVLVSSGGGDVRTGPSTLPGEEVTVESGTLDVVVEATDGVQPYNSSSDTTTADTLMCFRTLANGELVPEDILTGPGSVLLIQMWGLMMLMTSFRHRSLFPGVSLLTNVLLLYTITT
jgi:hypothetical protein